MAAAEARAVWQRTVNRCFVQEDAKRAPKLACCQSSSSSCKQADLSPNTAPDTQDHPMVGFMPFNRNPSCPDLPPDGRWWLQLQPSHGSSEGLTHEQLKALEALDPSSKESAVKPLQGHCNPKVGELEFEAPSYKTSKDFLGLMDTMKDCEVSWTDTIESQDFKISSDFCLDSEFPWVEGGKADPWWRTTDKDELAYLVAKKSVDYIVNCDLPPPQKMHSKKYSHKCAGCLDCDDTLALNQKHETRSITHPIFEACGSSDSGRTAITPRALVDESIVQSGFSESSSTTMKDVVEARVGENDPAKARLLEALCHSQTRAREAEEAAQRAYAEKEHVIKLFFRQASQLFAYKQWFRMLQLEALYVQIRSNEQQISTLFPSALPWMPLKGRKPRKNLLRGMKGKRGKPGGAQQEVARCAFAFALGLSLVGAGLLLGWTVGWMLPF